MDHRPLFEPPMPKEVHDEAVRAAPGVSAMEIWQFIPLVAGVIEGIRQGLAEIPLIKIGHYELGPIPIKRR